MKLGGCNLRQKSEKMSWSLIKSSTMEPRKHTVTLWRHLEIPAPSADCPENDATPAKGKHSALVFARCVCEEYGSTGNCLFMRDSLIEMVSQCANSVCVSLFIMLCHADLHPNRSLKWLVSVQIVCVYHYSLCYVMQTCIQIAH